MLLLLPGCGRPAPQHHHAEAGLLDSAADQQSHTDTGPRDQRPPDQPWRDTSADRDLLTDGADSQIGKDAALDLGNDLESDLRTDSGVDSQLPNPGRCATAPPITLLQGKATITADTSLYTNEFVGLSCSQWLGPYDGPQAYYRFAIKANKVYRFILHPSFKQAGLYAFKATSCTAQAITAECGSWGPKDGSRWYGSPGSPTVMYYWSKTPVDIVVAVDSKGSGGPFVLEVSELFHPFNRLCANAEPLPLTTGKAVVTGDTWPSLTPDEFSSDILCGTTRFTGPQVYYAFDGEVDKYYKITLAGIASRDQHFYIFGDDCSPWTIRADCSVYGKGGYLENAVASPGEATIYFHPESTEKYRIAIDGEAGASGGHFRLEIEEGTGPAHGSCSAAKPIKLVVGKATINDVNAGAANEHPGLTNCGGGGPQVYYELPMQAGNGYEIKLQASYSGILYVFRKSSCGNIAAVDADCGSASGATGASAGYTIGDKTLLFVPQVSGNYLIAVDSSRRHHRKLGPFTLQITEFSPPPNRRACDATPIALSSGSATLTASTYGAPNEFGMTAVDGVDCGQYYTFAAPQVYYALDAKGGEGYRMKLSPKSDHPRELYLFPDSVCADQAAIDAACASNGLNGDHSKYSPGQSSTELVFVPRTSGRFIVAVDSHLGYSTGGDFTLDVVKFTPPSNGTCAAATPIPLTNGRGTVSGMTLGMSDEFPGQIRCDNAAALDSGQAYHRLTLTAGEQVLLSLDADFLAKVYVFRASGGCSPTAIQADCSSQGVTGAFARREGGVLSLAFKAPSAGDYIIAVDGVGGESGTYTLSVRPGAAGLILSEVHLFTDYIVLENTRSVAVPLDGVELIHYDYPHTFGKPLAMTLPPSLGPGQKLALIGANNPTGTDVYVSNLQQWCSFVLTLCDGPCAASNTTNVLDAARFQCDGTSPAPDLPILLTFSPGPIVAPIGADWRNSYFHTGSAGTSPGFLKADWTVGKKTR